jgi:hypothetical protein
MDKTVVVLHKGSLARYNVCQKKNGDFIARLLNYSGRRENQPQEQFSLHKEGRHWEDDGVEQNLVDDVGFGLEYDRKQPDEPVYYQRGQDRRDQGDRP